MKRALSLLLCVAMLMSMVVVGTSAVEDTGEAVWDASLVSEENTKTAITFSLDKESYKPGDIVEVTAHVDSMWGDLSIPGRMPGFDQGFMPGMYGIGSIQTCLIYDTNVFTIPKGIKNLFRTSTITNADVATYDATPVKMAQSLNEQGKGYISVIMTAGNALNADEDAYAALGGSGDFFTAYFKIADNAPAGEYEFIVGAYTFADGTPSFETTDTFYGVDYTRKNNCFNYNSENIDVTYNIPEIVVEGNDVDPDLEAAQEVDALIDAIGDCFIVDPKTEAQLVAAEEAYAALTDTQKALVTKYDTLTQKRKDYDETVAWDNNDKADKVEKLIAAIGEVTYNSGDAIVAAEEAYAALTEAQQKLVDNYDVLVAARAEYDRTYPIMNVENLIANIPDFFAEDTKVYFTDAYNDEGNTVTNGYQNLPRTDEENVTTDSTVEFDYMYSSYTTERTTPRVGILRGIGNAMYIGYNFESKAFEAGGSAWISKDDTTIHASAPYDLKPNKIYHFAFTFEGKVATVSLDGVQMLSYDFSQGGDSNVLFTMLMPLNVESYFANLTVTAPDAVTDPLNNDSFRNGTYKLTPFDVKTPNDVEAAVVAAEEAYAALTAEQQALVKNYADLVAARKAVNEAKFNPDDLAAAEAVDALIAKIPEDVTAPILGGSVIHVASIGNQYSQIGKVNDVKPEDHDNLAPTYSFQFDFMIESVTDASNAYIGGSSENNKWMAYDVARKAFVIADAGPWSYSSTNNVLASYPVDIPAGEWHTAKFVWTTTGSEIYYDGVKVLEDANGAANGWNIFYPKNVTYFADNIEVAKDGIVLERKGDFTSGMPDCWFGLSDAYTAATVTPIYSDAEIVAAEEAYAALTDAQKALVTKLDVMTAARSAYDAAQAKMVDDLIDAIGNCFVIDPATEAQLEAAEAAYAALTEAQKALVTKYDTLVQNRKDYDETVAWDNGVKADAVKELIAAIGEVTYDSRAAIEKAETAYDALTDAQKALVDNYDVLVAARASFDRYLPVMNVENLISQIPAIPALTGNVYHKNCDGSSGYMNFAVGDDNLTWDFEATFDFYFTSYSTTERATIGGLRGTGNSEFVGYNFNTKAFEMGGKHWIAGGDENVYASRAYELQPNTAYNMGIKFVGHTATITLNGEEMVTYDFNNGGATDPAFFIFMPTYVDLYMQNLVITESHNAVNPSAKLFADANYQVITQDISTPNDVEAALVAAEDAYAALSDEDKALVKNYADLVAVREAVDALNAQYEQDAAAVVALIDAIKTEEDIAAAQNAYNALLPAARKFVTNYENLVNARVTIVREMIAAIGEVQTTSGDAIAAAEAKYAALTADQKALVDNYDVLTAARAEYDAMMNAVALAIRKIDQIGDVVIGGDSTVFGGQVIGFDLGGGDGYSQIGPHDPYPEGKAWGYEVAIYVTGINDASDAYYGGFTQNDQWATYDFTRKAFIITSAGAAWSGGYKDAESVLASYPVDLALNQWHTIGFFYEADGTIRCTLEGEEVLSYKFASANSGYFISYPKNIKGYLDNFKCWYEGALVADVTDLSKNNDGEDASGYYFALNSNKFYNAVVDEYSVDVGSRIADAEAAYNAVPDKAKAAVTNYDVLAAAIAKYNSTEVTGVSAIAEEGKITVNWNAVKDAGIYYIYCDGKVVGSVWNYLTTTYTFAAAPGEHSIYVDVYVKGEHNAYGTASAPVAVTVPAKVLPTANASATYNSITLTWDAVDGAAYYYVKTTIAGTSYIAKVYGTAHTINYLAADTEYTINIEAVRGYANNKVDKVDFAPVVETTTTAPAVRVTVDGDKYIVEWDAFDNTVIYYVKAKIGANSYIIPVSASSTTRTITAIADADYSITVEAYHSPKTTSAGYDIYSVYTYAAATNH